MPVPLPQSPQRSRVAARPRPAVCPARSGRLALLLALVAGALVLARADRALAAASAQPTGGSPPAAAPGPSSAARQLIIVRAPAYGDTYATLSAYGLADGARSLALGPWVARVGFNGFAPPGGKREGDGRTPSGTFAFQFMFGVDADPGVHYPYRRVGEEDVWDDDPSSPLYNEWVDVRSADPGQDPEPMFQVPAYDFGAVIAYNTSRVPGLGSAIFLHLGLGGPTAGCVSLPAVELVRLLRWMSPARHPEIEMGVRSGAHWLGRAVSRRRGGRTGAIRRRPS